MSRLADELSTYYDTEVRPEDDEDLNVHYSRVIDNLRARENSRTRTRERELQEDQSFDQGTF